MDERSAGTNISLGKGANYVHGSQNAVGAGAQVNIDTHARSEIRELIEQLNQKIDEHENELDDANSLRSSTEVLAERVANGAPDRSFVKVLLAGMTTLAAPVAAVADAINKIRQAIGF
ncbi:hypothetical protein [Amycolatopsis sp. cmx-4-68]|uniref:hypothetical protein n=1 Tax=Amycolatopsis sp. cmx-4-68 TaxID=2790938 RepID=UPI0039790B83